MSRVLLLEPDKILAQNVTVVLKRHGHSVDWQVEPQAAIDSTDGGQPDLVILDLTLAGRGGVEFLYELRSYPDWQQLPVVVYSDINPEDLTTSLGSLKELNITAYHRKSDTSLAQLAQTVDESL